MSNCAQTLGKHSPTVVPAKAGLGSRVRSVEQYMTHYRMYQVRADGHITGQPTEFEIPTDEAAIERARQMLNGTDIELWQGNRLVIGFKSPDK